MLKIIACDDDVAFLDNLHRMINRWSAETGTAVDVALVTRGEDLLARHAASRADIIMLDMIMPLVNGMDTARELRQSDTAVHLVFLTSSPEFALESYEVRAFDYLLKPVTYERLAQLLDELSSLRPAATDELVIKTSFGYHALRLSDIEYAEARNKHVIFHLRDGRDIEALGRVHTARAQLQAGIPRRLLCGAVRGRETLMLSSAELVLWAIHHATTLLFGVFASAALCGVEINRRHSLELVGVGAVTGTAFAIANLVGGELFARQAYPLVVHLPLVVYLCVRYRLSPLLSILGVTSAYLSCQFSNWVGIAAFAATDSQVAYYTARIITTLGVFAVLLHWASEIGPRLAIKSPTELEILLILPLVYYIFDYATNVYTTLFHSGSVVTVEFLSFALCAFYLMFLAVYLREYEAKEIAERERWMLATRDSAAIKELEAWRQSGRELSVLRHDMRHYLRGLAALIEEGHTDEALERIDALCETNDRTAVRRYCANETVNIALSSLSADINAHGITADLRAAVPETVHVGDVDLFSVVSNALDNAIAAASAAPEGKRFVDLDLRYEDGHLLLLVSNTFGRAPHMVDGMSVAQHTGHGFGTKSIMLAVERMNGNCQFRINGDRFELRAVM